MNFEVNRLVMLAAAKTITKVAPANSPIRELLGVLMESNSDTGEVFLTSTNHEVSIQQKLMASVNKKGVMLLDPRMLADMMAKLDGDFVSISSEKPHVLKVQGGRCTFLINCMSPVGYPKPIMPFPEQSVIMTGICSLAKRTTFVVSSDEKKLALQCVQVKLKNNAVQASASDGIGRVLMVRDESDLTDEREFLLPGRSLKTLASISEDTDVFEVSDMGNEVVFVRGDMIFTIRKMITGDFIDTNLLLKSFKPAYIAVADSGELKEAVNIVAVGAASGNSLEPVNINLTDGEIIVCYEGDSSAGGSRVKAKISKNTPTTGFFYNINALVKLFQITTGKVRLELCDRGIMLVKNSSMIYLQSPLKPNTKKKEFNVGKPDGEKPLKKKKEGDSAKGAKDVKKIAA